MVAPSPVVLRGAVAAVLVFLPPSLVRADSWGPRDDVGVAVVEMRTGKVLWEAWRRGEAPGDASPEAKAAVEWLLRLTEHGRGPVPGLAALPEVPAKDLVLKNPWPRVRDLGVAASAGKSLLYYRHSYGVIALDRQTKEEVWRLSTTRFPYPSQVWEAGDLVFIQIGSNVPKTLLWSLVGEPKGLPIRGLEPVTVRQRVAAAVLLHHYGEGYLRPELQKYVTELGQAVGDPDAGPAAKAIEKLLATWPRKRDGQRLLVGCVASLLQAGGNDPLQAFAWSGADRVLAWCLLQELIYGSPTDGYSRQGYNYAYSGWEEQPISLTETVKAELVRHCRQVVATGQGPEKPFAASVLASTAVGWARLTEAERKELFLSPHPSVWRWAAVGLVKNGRREQLVEWARERPADDHLDVVWVLKHNKPKEWSDRELAFWVACARHNPAGVAYALHTGDDPVPTAFRQPIRSYLEQEIAKPSVMEGGTQPEYSLCAAVYLLDAWKNSDDTPLLLEYLKHPVNITGTRQDGTMSREYGLRKHVRFLLERRGVKVPPGVVYEEVVGLGRQ